MNYLHQHHDGPQILHNQKIHFELHLHSEVEIIALYKGSASLSVDGKSYRMGAGDFLIVFPESLHSYAAEADVDVGKFIFSPEIIPELAPILKEQTPRFPILAKDCAAAKALADLSREILAEFEHSSPIVQKAYLLLLTGKILESLETEKQPKGSGDLLVQIIEYCKANFQNTITQADVARAMHISKSYLSHLFAGKLKMNFCCYINMLRVNEACRLLRQGEKGMLEVAEKSGFSSLRSFNRAFAKQMKCSPKEYRRQALAAEHPLPGAV